jgi:hypothetical protein
MEELNFVSYQTHVWVDGTSEEEFTDRYTRVIHGTTAEGHLYEKLIGIGVKSEWQRIDDWQTQNGSVY